MGEIQPPRRSSILKRWLKGMASTAFNLMDAVIMDDISRLVKKPNTKNNSQITIDLSKFIESQKQENSKDKKDENKNSQ